MLNNRLKLLVITNESKIDSAPGQKDAISLLVLKGWLDSVTYVSHALSKESKTNFDSVINALISVKFDAVLIWSPYKFPQNRMQFDQIVKVISDRPIFYWEGDPWTKYGLKPWTEQMKWWASISKALFTVAKEPHTSLIQEFSNTEILFIPHTYCHIQFAQQELHAPGALSGSNRVVMIGNQSARIPFIYGTQGSGNRFAAAVLIKLALKNDFSIYGKNWPRGISSGIVAYADQAELIRSFAISANWDNFTSHESYASDRLPISLLAGRAHVTSRHPGTNYYGGIENGLFESSSIVGLYETLKCLREMSPKKLTNLGFEGHKWVKNRYSHRQSAQFMLSKISSHVPRLTLYPWSEL
jgi:hypothetical protein